MVLALSSDNQGLSLRNWQLGHAHRTSTDPPTHNAPYCINVRADIRWLSHPDCENDEVGLLFKEMEGAQYSIPYEVMGSNQKLALYPRKVASKSLCVHDTYTQYDKHRA